MNDNIYNALDNISDINKDYIHEIVSEACYNKVYRHLPSHVFNLIWRNINCYPNDNEEIFDYKPKVQLYGM